MYVGMCVLYIYMPLYLALSTYVCGVLQQRVAVKWKRNNFIALNATLMWQQQLQKHNIGRQSVEMPHSHYKSRHRYPATCRHNVVRTYTHPQNNSNDEALRQPVGALPNIYNNSTKKQALRLAL